MAAYRRVYDSRRLQADCQELGSAPEPYARQSSIGYLYLFILALSFIHYRIQTSVNNVEGLQKKTRADDIQLSPTVKPSHTHQRPYH